MKFRAKVSQMGDKVIILIPTAYHKDAKQFVKRGYVDVEITKA